MFYFSLIIEVFNYIAFTLDRTFHTDMFTRTYKQYLFTSLDGAVVRRGSKTRVPDIVHTQVRMNEHKHEQKTKGFLLLVFHRPFLACVTLAQTAARSRCDDTCRKQKIF